MVDTIISPASIKAWKIPLARFTDDGGLVSTFIQNIAGHHPTWTFSPSQTDGLPDMRKHF